MKNFNTSNVTVYPAIALLVSLISSISIHQMLLFIQRYYNDYVIYIILEYFICQYFFIFLPA